MKDLNKLKEQYEKLGAEIKALEENPKRWRADEGEPYYCLNMVGEVIETREFTPFIDRWYYQIGNYFQTEVEAQAYRDKQILLQELKDFAEGGQFYRDAENWVIVFDGCKREFYTDSYLTQQDINQIYFQTNKSAEEAIAHFGDRLKLLL